MATRVKVPSPVNGATYAERLQQSKTAREFDGGPLTGVWRSGNWTGFGGAESLIREVINVGSMSAWNWDNITENPAAVKACIAETGSAPDWVTLRRKTSGGAYIVPKVWPQPKR